MAEINTWPGWKCVRQLGAGSFGKVYEIERDDSGKTYKAALKVISIPQNDSEIENAYSTGMDETAVTEYFRGFVTDVTNEIALMADLKGYTNIVSYEDHMMVEHEGKIGWDILIRMELLTPLQKWASEHPMDEREVIRLGCDMCQALELCHKSKIIHRDIKPQNIFVNKNGDFKLGDFGIARVVEKTNSVMSQKGTYTYMAPEVFQGRNYNETADIYSLGIVLYRFLNHNRTPFLPLGNINYQDQQIAQERRMAGETIPEPAMGSDKLKQAILMTLQYHPENRVQSATVLRRILEQCKSGAGSNDMKNANVQSVPQTPKVDLEGTLPVQPKIDLERTLPVQPKVDIQGTMFTQHRAETAGTSQVQNRIDNASVSATQDVNSEETVFVNANRNAAARIPQKPKKKTWIIGVVAAVLLVLAMVGAWAEKTAQRETALEMAENEVQEEKRPAGTESSELPQEGQNGSFEAPEKERQEEEYNSGSIEIEGELRAISPTKVLLVGDNVMLSVATDNFVFDNSSKDLNFYSTNSSIATVSSNGIITGVSQGYANLTVEYEGQEATCRIYVAKNVTDPYSQIIPEYEKISVHPYEEVTVNLTLDGHLPERFGASCYSSGNLRMNLKFGQLEGNVLPLTIYALGTSDEDAVVTVLVYPEDDPTNLRSTVSFKVKSN